MRSRGLCGRVFGVDIGLEAGIGKFKRATNPVNGIKQPYGDVKALTVKQAARLLDEGYAVALEAVLFDEEGHKYAKWNN